MLRPLYMYSTIIGLATLLCYAWASPLSRVTLSSTLAQILPFVDTTATSQYHKHGSHCQHHHQEQADPTAQPWECGQSEYHQQLLEKYPDLIPRIQRHEQRWSAYQQMGHSLNATGGVHTVPVVVHLIHSNAGPNLTNVQVQTALRHLNEAFANIGYYNPATGVDTEIQFCLASRDPAGNTTNGITSTVSPLTMLDKNTQDAQLKNTIRWDPTRYINIWVVDDILGGVAGYATLPFVHGQAIDGVVIEAYFMGRTPDRASVLVHELGHYFGLFHTFEGGCSNADCTAQGDRVCDTPPDNTTARPPCNVAVNSCTSDADDPSTNNPFRAAALGGQGDQPDQRENYMDYSDLSCYDRFTQGQADRMQFYLHGARASLLRSQVCAPPCTNPIQVGFTASALTTTAGTPITFTDTSTNGTASQWSIDGVSFGTTTVATYNFPTVGGFWVRLDASNGDPNCLQSDSVYITVFCAPPCGEICDNGIDDDGNGWIDCYDTACACAPCSDKRANVWHFGDEALLDFNAGSPIQGTGSQLSSQEACATMCDANGNVLFYTDSERVWTRNNFAMPNGFTLDGHFSTSQIVIVPKPDDPYLFYIFYPDMNNVSNGLRYAVVDMSTNSNLGSVTQKDIVLDSNKTTEHIAAIKQCNNKDYWLITKLFETNRYLVYPITSAGIGTPIVQNIGRIHARTTTFGENAGGCMAVNTTGDQIAMTHRVTAVVELLDFDRSTGQLSNVIEWQIPNIRSLYGAEYSPDGQLLYTTDLVSGTLFQYDVTLPTSTAIANSEYIVAQGSRTQFGAIRHAPDGKLYHNYAFRNNLGVINNPNQRGGACNHQAFGVLLTNNKIAEYGLPSPLKDFFTENISSNLVGPTTICTDTALMVHYRIDNPTCIIDTVIWRHSGSNSILSTSDSLLQLDVTTSGNDTIWATMVSSCTTKTDQLIVRSLLQPTVDLGPDTSICQHGIIPLDVGTGYQSCIWQDGSQQPNLTAFESGLYWVECTTYCGDTLRDSIRIQIGAAPSINYPDTTINSGDTLRLTTVAGGINHVWTPDSSLSCTQCPLPLFYPTVTTTYYHVYADSNGCVGLDTVTVSVTNPCAPQVQVDSTVQPCAGSTNGALFVSTTNGLAPYSYRWSNGDTTATLTGLGPGTFRVTVTDARNCVVVDTIVLPTAAPIQVRIDTVTLPSCAGLASAGELLAVASGGLPPYTYQWNRGPTTANLLDTNMTGFYRVTVTDASGCTGSSIDLRISPPQVLNLTLNAVRQYCNSNQRGIACVETVGGTPPYQYQWSTSSSTDSCATDLDHWPSGAYQVTVTDANRCVNVIGGLISNAPTPQIVIDTLRAPTPGQADGILLVRYLTPSAGIPSYEWNTGATTDTLYNVPAGTYSVTVTTSSGCTDTTSAVLTDWDCSLVSGIIRGNGSKDYCIEVINGTPPYQYQWDGLASGTDSCTMIPTVTGGVMSVTVMTQRGCEVIASLVLHVQERPALPNAFTPNGDGTNDVFRLVNVSDQNVEQFRIFNRWGQVVFDAEGQVPAWDGTFRGVPQPTEVYLYHLRYRLNGTLIEERGEVTLLR